MADLLVRGRLNLVRLSQIDREAAEVGWQLNHPQTGVDLDRDPLMLHPQELRHAAPYFIAANPAYAAPIHRLRAYLEGGSSTPVDPGPGFVGATDIVKLGQGVGLDTKSSALPLGRGRTLVVWDNSNVDFTSSGLQGVVMDPAGQVESQSQFDLPPGLVAGPSLVKVGDQAFLYASVAPTVDAPAQGYRFAVNPDGSFGAPEAFQWPQGVDTLLSWPTLVQLKDDKVGVGYRDRFGQILMSSTQDGLHFSPPTRIDQRGDSMPYVARCGQGLAATFQRPEQGESMVSYLKLSSDGQRWSQPVRVSENSSNVHDTQILPRDDGGADLYYIYPVENVGFSVFRRAVDETGQLGPEQRVTGNDLKDVMKPQATRLADGRLQLKFASGLARSPQGFPSIQRLDSVILDGDAPK